MKVGQDYHMSYQEGEVFNLSMVFWFSAAVTVSYLLSQAYLFFVR